MYIICACVSLIYEKDLISLGTGRNTHYFFNKVNYNGRYTRLVILVFILYSTWYTHFSKMFIQEYRVFKKINV